jgi:hypothetical protein
MIDRIRAHEAVDAVCVEPGDFGDSYFVYLKKGWEWSEQTGFGCEAITEAWRLTKEARKVV